MTRKGWFVCASDDMKLRVFNYSTSEKVKEWEAHTDYIRTVEVHPTLPYILSSSDDMSVKLWDWDKVRGGGGPTNTHTHRRCRVGFGKRTRERERERGGNAGTTVWPQRGRANQGGISRPPLITTGTGASTLHPPSPPPPSKLKP